ncbi:hypothetical protein GCM10009540_21870 [Streptomyces turgidiscabies]
MGFHQPGIVWIAAADRCEMPQQADAFQVFPYGAFRIVAHDRQGLFEGVQRSDEKAGGGCLRG